MPRVLIVDDDPLIGDCVAILLTRSGMNTDVAGSARTALQKLAAASYDIVITDIIMPDMDGIELLKAIRNLSADLPVIAMTGTDARFKPALMQMMPTLGATAVISKPFEPEHLIDEVRRLCADRQSA